MDPVLTREDRASPTWVKLQRYLQGRLQKLREKNDQRLPEDKTAQVRGAISEVKFLLSQGTNEPTDYEDDTLFKD